MAESTQEIVDRFAAQALSAILSNPEIMQAVTKMGSQAIMYEEAIRAVANKSYEIAAAMMIERSKRLRAEPEFTFKPKKPTL
jgi:hypothetical protein